MSAFARRAVPQPRRHVSHPPCLFDADAGVGGLSGALGWTEAQREANRSQGFAGGAENLIKIGAVLLVLDLVWFGYSVSSCFVVPSGHSKSGC